MAGPDNGIMGDLDDPMVQPHTEVPEDQLKAEELELRNMAKFSKTKEYKKLREFMEARISFYQKFLPNGAQVEGRPDNNNGFSVNVPHGDLTSNWIAACIVIKELENILGEYEQAAEVAKNKNGR
jgi:hypothetical protein